MDLPAISDVVAAVGEANVVVDAEMRASFETDWTRRWSGPCDAVIRPRDVSQVSAVLQWACAHDVSVVTQGGNTGLVGGSVPAASSPRPLVLLSTRRLDDVFEVDLASGQATIGAGVTLASLDARLLGSGWEFGVDLGARDSATLGGMAATNAGGTRVLRHGMMRRNVLGIEAVLADGSVVSSMRGLEKDNTGYDVTGLMVGSEGTLGVITAVRVRLVPTRTERTTILVTCHGWSDALALANEIRRIEGTEALEAVDSRTAEAVRTATGHGPTLATDEVALLVEWAGDADAPMTLMDAIGDRSHAVARDSGGRRDLWQVRDRATESIARLGIPHKLDVTLPLSTLASFVIHVTRLVEEARHEVFVFGHLGDGNLHVNIVGPAAADERIDGAVLELAASLGGSISAEHGIGRHKRSHLPLSRSSTEIAVMRSIKAALDPKGLLNPGVLL